MENRRNEYILHVFGIVQGVGFRNFIKKTADHFRLPGYVRNSSDGSVLICIQSDSQTFHAFHEICKKGTTHAHINGISVTKQICKKRLADFQILY